MSRITLAAGSQSRTETFDTVRAYNHLLLSDLGNISTRFSPLPSPFSSLLTLIYLLIVVSAQWPLIGDLMSSCMTEPSALQQSSLSTLRTFVSTHILTMANSTSSAFLPVLARLHQIGVDVFWSPGVGRNLNEDVSKNWLWLQMSGIAVNLDVEAVQVSEVGAFACVLVCACGKDVARACGCVCACDDIGSAVVFCGACYWRLHQRESTRCSESGECFTWVCAWCYTFGDIRK